MKKYTILCFLFLITTNVGLAQEANLQQEINDQVWRPFIKTYGAFDTEGFMAIHTKDVVRINRDGQSIRIGEEYNESMQSSNKRSIENGSKRTIEFTFLERIARPEVAFEVGYYKVTYTPKGKDPRVFYGKFQVLLKKVNERWQLDIDSDTSNNGKFTEENFQSGKKMEEWE